eukprot:TRINITY_DN8127_c0_g1_i2.p2 TRINITY_DN8127_c0_g1~~TRINITY_DN8127_c0_g1_i2.p2  ORF type:complete len:225 (-),score=50.99 TRINITY_DN8127_c0_g1_i2:125-799(-)
MGYVEFEDVRHARDVFNFFNSGSRISVNKDGKAMKILWCYNRLHSESWVAVVLRNIPPSDANLEAIRKNCTKHSEKVKLITPPTSVKGRWCCLVVVEDIEDAEKICLRINNYAFDKGKIRAHVHPSSDTRRSGERSHNVLFAHMQEYVPKDHPLASKKIEGQPTKKAIRKQKEVPKTKHKQIRDSLLDLNESRKEMPVFIRELFKTDSIPKNKQGVFLGKSTQL